MAEPVQCLSGIGGELENLLLVDGDDSSASVLMDESVKPVSSSLRPTMAQTDGTKLLASTVSTTTAEAMDPDPPTLLAGGPHNHIDSLLHSLPSDLSGEQRARGDVHSQSCGCLLQVRV